MQPENLNSPPAKKSRMKEGSRRSLAALRRIAKANARAARAEAEGVKKAARAEKQARDTKRKADLALRRKAKRERANRVAARKKERQLSALPPEIRDAHQRRAARGRQRYLERHASGLPQPIWGSHREARAHNEALYESDGWKLRMETIIAYCAAGLKFEDAAHKVFVHYLTAGRWFYRRPQYNLPCTNPFEPEEPRKVHPRDWHNPKHTTRAERAANRARSNGIRAYRRSNTGRKRANG